MVIKSVEKAYELFPTVNAVNTLGYLWGKQKNLFYYDNQAVADIWRRGTTCDSETMAPVHFLYFCVACYNFTVVIIHTWYLHLHCRFLSRFQLHRFQVLAPEAHPSPDLIVHS